MKGVNELRLSSAMMCDIVQQWLDEEMPNHPPTVTAVTSNPDNPGGFKVVLQEEATKP